MQNQTLTCSTCGITGARPTDYAGWRRILGRMLCRTCAAGFPSWMR